MSSCLSHTQPSPGCPFCTDGQTENRARLRARAEAAYARAAGLQHKLDEREKLVNQYSERVESKTLELAALHVRFNDLHDENARLREALEGVLRVADRKTQEFDAAREALVPRQIEKETK